MRTLLLLSIAIGLSIGISSSALAVCQQNGNTPGGGNIINCPAPVQNTSLNTASNPGTTILPDEVNVPEGGGIETGESRAINTDSGDDVVTTSGDLTGNAQAIRTEDGNDIVTVNGGRVIGMDSQAIDTGEDDDMITINDGYVEGGVIGGGDQAIFTRGGNDMITINGGTVVGNTNQVIFSSSGNDKIIVNGGLLKVVDGINDEIIFTGGEDDMVELNGGTYMNGGDEAIDLGSENDMLTFGTDIDLGQGAFVNCGDDFDTLVFAMNVREPFLAEAKERLAAATLPDGNVFINNINYRWINCELLVDELQAGPPGNLKPIPTLSQWGLIAMAGLIGIVGLFVMRRRALNS